MFLLGAYLGMFLIMIVIVLGASVMSFGAWNTFVGCAVLLTGIAFMLGMGCLFVWLDRRYMEEEGE